MASQSSLAIAFGAAASLFACSLWAASVPFVGCPSFGQIKRLDAPKGKSHAVPISGKDAQKLAFYASGDGTGILAPRGWYCQGASGSGGAVLYVGPKAIVPRSSGWQGLDGPVVEVNDTNAENSGRYDIAELISRVFPKYLLFARKTWAYMDSPLPTGAYPLDKLTYRGDNVLEFTTPGETEGLGNFDSNIGKNELPIAGVAILSIDSAHLDSSIPHLLRISIRLPRDLAWVTPTIIGYAERTAAATR